ncbi:ABC transporter substrate-binding protein [Streptomyces sp. NPDC056707]|uniref:ABC transporter substrate-binding protein n=1 Tax=Streptomyces sp. NPDC056707 TaxID=3345919 RepID=UPI0036C6551A
MKRTFAAATAICGLAFATTACGGDNTTASSGGQELKGQTVTVAAVWTGVEQENFKQVLDGFTAKTGAKTRFVSTGDNVSTVVGSKIEGGDAPEVVMVPQVGVLQQFASKGWLQPLSPAVKSATEKNFAKVWRDYGTVDGTLYGLYFKASNKSTVWYSPQALDDAGVQPPKNFKELLTVAGAVSDSGLPAFSVAGEAGWPLTDWFENIYLSQAGPDNYDKLAQHKIPWTDPTVVKALGTLAELFGKDDLIAGGRKGALQTDFPESVEQVFGKSPKAGMVYEGDFVGGIVSGDLGGTVGEDAKFFPFPAVDGGPAPVVGGGDAAVALKAGKNGKAAMKLLEYLASPEAAEIWAKAGGYLSPNKQLDPASYADETLRQTAKSLVDAGDTVRFDMSDQAPAAFGGTQGSGEWKILQDFLRDPSDPKGTARKLEAAAVKAYKD